MKCWLTLGLIALSVSALAQGGVGETPLGTCRYLITHDASWHVRVQGDPGWGRFQIKGTLWVWMNRYGPDGPFTKEEVEFDSPNPDLDIDAVFVHQHWYVQQVEAGACRAYRSGS